MTNRKYLLAMFLAAAGAWGQEIKGPEQVPDFKGMERWYREAQGKPWFFKLLEALYNETVGTPPFGRSVALLVGVGEYEFISTQLPSVQNDLVQMREFLLDRGGFDEVFIIRDKAVNRDVLERCFQDFLPKRLGPQDRLLFYYTGHGDDDEGHTGYLQFGGARPRQFWGNQVLKVGAVHDWMKKLTGVKHQLYLLDCCASGLAIASKSGGEDCDSAILDALRGKGSRAIITAGTGDQKVYARGRGTAGNGVLTRAFLDAFSTRRIGQQCNMLTPHEVFGYIQKSVAAFKVAEDRTMTPVIWTSPAPEHEGTFVFVSAQAGNHELTEPQRVALGAVAKAGTEIEPAGYFGSVLLISFVKGTVSINDRPAGSIDAGEGKTFALPVGKHRIEVRGESATLSKTVLVARGETATVTLRQPDREEGRPSLLDLEKPPRHGEKRTFKITDELSIDMVWLEPGSFMMGSPETEPERMENETRHKVMLTKGFWIGETEVSQILWTAVMGSNPSKFVGPKHPVESVSWEDCTAFISKVNGMNPGLNLRLPTEAEWEYACRAGTDTPFSFGKAITTDQVNYDGNYHYPGGAKGRYRKETVPVKSLPANLWGLYEMHGNVWEWCADWIGDYPALPDTDPVGPDSGGYRVLRGGSWVNGGRYVRSASRDYAPPGSRAGNIGFRLARGH